MLVATIEARMTSSRLPGKMMLPLGGQPALGVLIDRLKMVDELDAIVLATTINKSDDVLADVANQGGIRVFRGGEDDVLGRVRGALETLPRDEPFPGLLSAAGGNSVTRLGCRIAAVRILLIAGAHGGGPAQFARKDSLAVSGS